MPLLLPVVYSASGSRKSLLIIATCPGISWHILFLHCSAPLGKSPLTGPTLRWHCIKALDGSLPWLLTQVHSGCCTSRIGLSNFYSLRHDVRLQQISMSRAARAVGGPRSGNFKTLYTTVTICRLGSFLRTNLGTARLWVLNGTISHVAG